MNGEFVGLCNIAEIPDGAARGFDPLGHGRDSLFVVRRGDTLNAYLNLCPHAGATLPWQKDRYLNADGTLIVCHAHGAQFDPDSGRCVLGPALGKSLYRIDLKQDDDGMVYAHLNTEKSKEQSNEH